jgi:hypothetical protein
VRKTLDTTYLADVLPGLANRSIQSLAGLTPEACAARVTK